jgi:hypothetical protein
MQPVCQKMVDQTLHSATGPPLAIEVNGGNEPDEHDQYRQADETGGAGIGGHFRDLIAIRMTLWVGIAQTINARADQTAVCITLILDRVSKSCRKIDG